jgi:hypothetical protein
MGRGIGEQERFNLSPKPSSKEDGAVDPILENSEEEAEQPHYPDVNGVRYDIAGVDIDMEGGRGVVHIRDVDFDMDYSIAGRRDNNGGIILEKAHSRPNEKVWSREALLRQIVAGVLNDRIPK